MAAVGNDPAAIVKAAVRKDTVRKRGLRNSDFSATPIEGIPPHAEIDVYLNKITVAGGFTPGIISPATVGYGWSEVFIAEDDFQQFLAQYYDLLPQQSSNDTIPDPDGSGVPARTCAPGLNYKSNDAPLVAAGVAGVRTGEYKNATDAARALAKDAVGSKKEESRMFRLMKQIQRALNQS